MADPFFSQQSGKTPVGAIDLTRIDLPAGHAWSVELLRGMAALLVVVSHYQHLAGMDFGILRFAFSGVDLFFVLSGFVFAPYLFGRKICLAVFSDHPWRSAVGPLALGGALTLTRTETGSSMSFISLGHTSIPDRNFHP